MAFNTASFWAFFVVVLTISASLRRYARLRIWFLTIASLYFYYASNSYLTLLIIGGTLFDFFAARKIQALSSNPARKRWLISSITLNLTILGLFKYSNLLLATIDRGLLMAGFHSKLPLLHLPLPVGISFYTFEAISYVADVYRRRFTARTQWRDFNYFIVFFPKLTAGPIIRPQAFFDNIAGEKPLGEKEFEGYFQMMFLGLIQKVVLADTLAPIADAVYGGTAAPDFLTTLVGIYAFSLQIYFDFVGYTNIAIGAAGLLGVELPDNFNRPYIASCLSDFWRRWHISLSSWLRDYLYIPLGGGRGSLAMICRNLMITMTLGGLWHGASWNFAIWGALNGAILCLERLSGWEARANHWLARHGSGARLLWSALMFNLFSLLWVPFRAHSLDDFISILRRLLSLTPPQTVVFQELAVCALAFLTIAVCVWDENTGLQGWISNLHPLVKAPVFATAILVSIGFSTAGNQPFIYFRF